MFYAHDRANRHTGSRKPSRGHLPSLLTILPLAVLGMLLSIATPLKAQMNSDLYMDLTIDERLSNAQVINLNQLDLNASGTNRELFNILVENQSNERLEDLYFHLEVEASGLGTLAEAYQRQGFPYYLEPRQSIMANNNRFIGSPPGNVQHTQHIETEVMQAGEELVNQMQGTTRLPTQIYIFTLQVYQHANKRNGGELLGEVSGSVGSAAGAGGGELFLDLLGPGDEVGTGDATVMTSRPVFNWDGDPDQEYRLVVVEDTGNDNPETLIQNALSTDPMIGTDETGDYLDYEMADVVVSGTTNFSYPTSRVQTLEQGQRYYWQVFTQVRTGGGIDRVPSPIWEFTVEEYGEITGEMREEVREHLTQLLSAQQMEELLEQGYELGSIEYQGQIYTGPQVEQILREILQDVQQGEITITR